MKSVIAKLSDEAIDEDLSTCLKNLKFLKNLNRPATNTETTAYDYIQEYKRRFYLRQRGSHGTS